MPEASENEKKLSAEMLASIRQEAINQVAKWAVAGGALLAVAAATGWWLYLKPRLIETVGGLPAGAVVAFDLPNGCPDGWTMFDRAISRVIVGSVAGRSAGEPIRDRTGKVLTARPYRDEGGEETHSLTVEEMPPHRHQTPLVAAPDQVTFGVGTSARGIGGLNIQVNTGALTSDAGGGKSHNIMPPFVALFYCRKAA
jgi:hypothetical protein